MPKSLYIRINIVNNCSIQIIWPIVMHRSKVHMLALQDIELKLPTNLPFIK